MRNATRRKSEILNSAIAVFSQKGLADATLSEIAAGAGITPQAVYTHFRGKEDILVTIIGDFLEANHARLREHLAGIEGAKNRLRKAVWYHCSEYSKNRDIIKIVLEARSYPGFYQSGAYGHLRAYSRVFMEIIREGVDGGAFMKISRPSVIRDMILGMVDHIAINWTINNAPNSLDKVEAIVDLVFRAVQPAREHAPPDKKEQKRRRIINSATGVFAKNGYSRAGMLEIAEGAQVAEGTVYEYFGGKEDLFLSIPGEKLRELHGRISGESVATRLRDILLTLFRFHGENKDYATILVMGLRTNRKFHQSESHGILEDIHGEVVAVITRGQEQGVFDPDLDLDLLRDLVFGTMDHILIPWIMFDRKYDLEEAGKEFSTLVLNAISKREGEAGNGKPE
ncbi:MAG: TetR/AcrR family transcriptional regulator [Desulfatibacillaceae bacterium]